MCYAVAMLFSLGESDFCAEGVHEKYKYCVFCLDLWRGKCLRRCCLSKAKPWWWSKISGKSFHVLLWLTKEGKSSSFIWLSVQLCPSLCHQFLLRQAAVPGSSAAGAGAGAAPSGEETMLLWPDYQWYRCSCLFWAYKKLPRHRLWLNWTIKERFGVPGEIQCSWRDPHAGSKAEPKLVWRNPYSGKTEEQTCRPWYHPTAPLSRHSAAVMNHPSASSCSQDISAGSVVAEFKIFSIYLLT